MGSKELWGQAINYGVSEQKVEQTGVGRFSGKITSNRLH